MKRREPQSVKIHDSIQEIAAHKEGLSTVDDLEGWS
jgi:hypothetical protein